VATILLVEDEAPLRRLMAQALVRAGHAVVPAADGESAMVALEALRPDAVVSDFSLPGRADGLNILAALRKGGSKAPFLLVSAVADRKRAVHNGADAFLEKPFKMRGLVAMVKYLLHPERLKRG
jgi:DNA-binding response OmpR family regulator